MTKIITCAIDCVCCLIMKLRTKSFWFLDFRSTECDFIWFDQGFWRRCRQNFTGSRQPLEWIFRNTCVTSFILRLETVDEQSRSCESESEGADWIFFLFQTEGIVHWLQFVWRVGEGRRETRVCQWNSIAFSIGTWQLSVALKKCE